MAQLLSHQAVLKTLLVSDLVGSTYLVEQLGDKQSARLFKRHDRLARDLLARHDGREIDKTDGFLLLFDRPFEAVRYALAYHRALAGLAAEAGVELASRVGIHLGEVFLRENRPEDVARGAKPLEVEGLAKPTAARLMSLAAGRQTLLTRGAFDLAHRAAVGAEAPSGDLRWLAHGAYRFQGVEQPIQVFEVGVEGAAPLAPPRDSAKARRVVEGKSGGGRSQAAVATGSWLLDRYELKGELGRGGMGVVYRANDPLLGREVAVKMIPPGTLGPGSEERFRREAQVVAQMDHPGIVAIHDFGEHQGFVFLVMPLLRGVNLRQLIRNQSLRLGETLQIAAQIAEALDHSHARGIVHRDVKPENVMVDRGPGGVRVRVMDFGLALGGEEARLTGSDGFVGTVAYMSPEQLTSGPIDGRTDLYALGTVLYECLAGEPPFSGAVHSLIYRVVHEYPRSLRARGVRVDGALDEIVLSCLAKEPSKRPESAAALARALRSCQEKLEDREQTTLVADSGRTARLRPRVAPLVGREAEIAELQARLHAASEGECQLVLVEGEAGMGKSLLLGELEKLAVARGIRVLRGRFTDHQGALPSQGFCELVQASVRSREIAGESSEAADLTDLAPDLVALFPVFSEIAELRAASTSDGRAPVESAAHKEATFVFELVARTLTRLAAGRPLVLLLENLHAAAAGIDALEYVVHRLGPTPTLFAGTFRPAEIDRGHPLSRLLRSFRDDPRFSRVVLGPLSVEGFRQLVAVMVGTGQVADDLVMKLYEATEGNYFFGQELIRSLLESNAIRRDESGVWVLMRRGGITTEALPVTIWQAVDRRIDRLADEHRKVLAAASVLGRSFDYDDLEALLGEVADFEDIVDSLIDSGILEEDRRSRGDRLDFASGIVCDMLYRGLPRRKRRTFHRRHAERLEVRYAGRLERVYPHLVHHFSEGDVASKTVSYGLAQARRSLEAWSPGEAARFCRTALEFVDEDDVDHSVVVRGELQLVLARAERVNGDLERAFREAERAASAFADAGELGEAAETALFLAETAWQWRRGDETWRWVERGVELARAADRFETLRQLLILGATVANLRGVYRTARRFLEEAERLAPSEAGDAAEQAVPAGGTLVVALPATVVSLDPRQLQFGTEAEVFLQVFQTLLGTSEDGALVPSLGSGWRDAGDGKTFQLFLRPNLRFSDGSPLRAGEVKKSLQRSAGRRGDALATALSTVEGAAESFAGAGHEISGIEIEDDLTLTFRLVEPLPIFPMVLTNPATAIVKEEGPSSELLGTGPFRLTRQDVGAGRIVLGRNSRYCGEQAPRLERVEFRTFAGASSIAADLLSGEIDLGGDLLPADLEETLRDPRFRPGLVEATAKNVYFVLFNQSGPAARSRAVRQALAGIIRTSDLVWRSLGRFAQPAVSLVPPGVLGHDPGRRRPSLTHDGASALLDAAGIKAPIPIRATVQPLMIDRYGALTRSLLAEWKTLGFEITVQSGSVEQYAETFQVNEDFDLIIARWIGDYNDPDNFTYSLFHSRDGFYRRYYSSSEADKLLEQARQEREPANRHALYQRFEDLLDRESVFVPLFHDVNYRVASPRVRGLRLSNTLPYVDYSMVGKVGEAAIDTTQAVRIRSTRRAEIHVALQTRVDTLDPTAGGMLGDYYEAGGSVFETLTRVEEGARIVPWLAASFESAEGGRSHRFRLRDDVHFHDGRRLSVRDVRYSFERALRSPHSEIPSALTPVRGARALRDGEADDLAGLRILSATEFVIDLEQPVSFFPALMTGGMVAIVPEGSETFVGRWCDGCVGTGPFRVAAFRPGKRLELEKNPDYWRSGYPKSDYLVFHFGGSPGQWCDDFRHGRLTLAAELLPADVEALRRDPSFASGYREAPRLATYLLALNTRQEPFSDPGFRRAFAEAIDIDTALEETAGRLVQRARGLIPPGLLGYEPTAGTDRLTFTPYPLSSKLDLKAEHTPPYAGQYTALWERLRGLWNEAGFSISSRSTRLKELANRLRTGSSGSADLLACRWIADYPDADGFVGILLHSSDGYLGSFCSTPATDRLIEAGRAETAPSLRHAIYREIEEIIARDALLIPLFHEQTYRFCTSKVDGLRLIQGTGSGGVRYEELYARRE